MAYCTQDDLVTRFGEEELAQLTDHNWEDGRLDETVIARAIDDATGEIDARLVKRYPLPLETTPRLLTRVACDIARFYLYQDRVTETVEKRYAAAIKLLDGIARGDVSLGLESTQQPQDGPAEITSAERLFKRSSMGDLL